MKTVKDLVEQIISYSHDENTPDNKLTEKALVWLNSAYHEVLQENLVYLKHKMIKYTSVSVENASFELPEDFYILEKLILDNKTVISKEEKDKYDKELNKIVLTDENVKNVDLVYIPEFRVLQLEDSLNVLHMDYANAKNLIWGALVWSSIYERGINTSSEINLFDSKWKQMKQNFKLSLDTYNSEFLRTTPYRFLN